MAEFEKIKIAVNEAEHQAMLSTYEGRIEFYQSTINQIKNIVPSFVFETSDLVPLFNDPKAYLVDKLIQEPLTIGGLELDKDKVFDLLDNSEQLKSVIAYINGFKQSTSPYQSERNLHIYSKDYEITKSESDSYEVKLKDSAKNSLEDQYSIYLRTQKQKNAYDSISVIESELRKLAEINHRSHIKFIDEFFIWNAGGELLSINYKAFQSII